MNIFGLIVIIIKDKNMSLSIPDQNIKESGKNLLPSFNTLISSLDQTDNIHFSDYNIIPDPNYLYFNSFGNQAV